MKWIADGTVIESLAGRTAQKRQQTWESDNTIRHDSHQSGSLQNGLGENTPNIHNATLFYIFLSTLKGYDSSALL